MDLRNQRKDRLEVATRPRRVFTRVSAFDVGQVADPQDGGMEEWPRNTTSCSIGAAREQKQVAPRSNPIAKTRMRAMSRNWPAEYSSATADRVLDQLNGTDDERPRASDTRWSLLQPSP